MGKDTCELCGRESERGTVKKHHIVPIDITRQASMPESKTVRLCPDCHHEIQTWYATRVTAVTYDLGIKQFKDKSWSELVKEYHFAFNSFVSYMKGRN